MKSSFNHFSGTPKGVKEILRAVLKFVFAKVT